MLNTAKKPAYYASMLGTVGMTGLAIEDAINDGGEFEKLNNVTSELYDSVDQYKQLDHATAAAVERLTVKDSAMHDHLLGLDGALQTTVILNSVSSAVDQMTLSFRAKADLVKSTFNSYNKIVDALTSKVFNEPLITKGIFSASKNLPSNYGFLSDNLFDIINTATTSHSLTDSILSVNLHIPVVHDKVILYLFKAFELPYTTEEGQAVLPIYEAPFIAVTADLKYYALVHPRDLIACTYKDQFLCPSLPLMSNAVQTCIFAHFLKNDLKAKNA